MQNYGDGRLRRVSIRLRRKKSQFNSLTTVTIHYPRTRIFFLTAAEIWGIEKTSAR